MKFTTLPLISKTPSTVWKRHTLPLCDDWNENHKDLNERRYYSIVSFMLHQFYAESRIKTFSNKIKLISKHLFSRDLTFVFYMYKLTLHLSFFLIFTNKNLYKNTVYWLKDILQKLRNNNCLLHFNLIIFFLQYTKWILFLLHFDKQTTEICIHFFQTIKWNGHNSLNLQ